MPLDSSQYQVGYCFERANNLPGAAINNHFYAKTVTGLLPKTVMEASGNMLPSGRTPQRVPDRVGRRRQDRLRSGC